MIFDKFGGIQRELAMPPNATFEDLLNLRLDRMQNALAPRKGIKLFPNDTFDLGAELLCFRDVVFPGSTNTRVFVHTDGISVDEGSHVLRSLTDRQTDIQINTVTTDVQYVLTDDLALPVGCIVHRAEEGTASEYFVVTAYNAGTKTITINRAPRHEWLANDYLEFFLTDLASAWTLAKITDSYPCLDVIDNLNNQVVPGVKISSTSQTPWVGKIPNRYYFGNEFMYNGLYATSLAERFDRGAFRSSARHIKTTVITAGTLASSNYESSPTGVLGTATGWADNDGGALQANKLLAPAGVDDPATYFTPTTPLTAAGQYFTVQMSRPTSAAVLSENEYGFILLWGALNCAPSPFGKTIQRTKFKVQFGFYDTLSSAFTVAHEEMCEFGVIQNEGDLGGWESGLITSFQVSQKLLGTLGDASNVFAVRIIDNNTDGGTQGWRLSGINLQLTYDKTVVTPIQNLLGTNGSPEDTVYGVNFSLILDGVNETPLIYSYPYGAEHSATTFTESCLVKGLHGNYLGLEISTPWAALVNRRVTGLRVWGGKLVADTWVWRLCSTISINADWTTDTSGLIDSKYVRINIGNEINTGATYEERNNRYAHAELIQMISSFVRVNNRSYAVADENKQNIYYSAIGVNGYETSILDNSSYRIDNECPGDILRMSIIGRKLVIFKGNSFSSTDVDSLQNGGRITVLSTNRGLVSVYGVVNSGDMLTFPTQSDIRTTDGFKTREINSDWIEDYAGMSVLSKASVLGWFDSWSDSMYFQFYDGATENYDLWVFQLPTQTWRREDFRYTEDDAYLPTTGVLDKTKMTKAGIFIYASPNLSTGRMLLADNPALFDPERGRMYEFPRADNLDTNRVIVSGVATELPTYCFFKTNQVESDESIGVGLYIDGGFIKATLKYDSLSAGFLTGSLIGSFVLNIYEGDTLVKAIPIEYGREESTVSIRRPVSRWALSASFYINQMFAIKQFGTLIKSAKKSGSVKQVLS